MGKKRKSKPMRPWCWYCEKDFEDDKVLVTHQRAKHFKCEECNKKLTTAGGMVVHSHQVHKIDIYKVPNALPGRDRLDIEIFGMEGIPEEDMIAHELRLAGANGNKKAKSGGSGQYGELTIEQIQQQMAAHKAGSAAAAGYPPPATESSPVIAAPPVIQQPPQPAQQNYYDAYNPYGGYQQPFANQYYPAQSAYGQPPLPPQNYGYPAAAGPNAGMVPPVPYPGQWGYQPYGNNSTMPRPAHQQQQPSSASASSVPVATAPVSAAQVNAPTTPPTSALSPPLSTQPSVTEAPQHNPPPLPATKQEEQQQPAPSSLDKPISPVATNGKKKATKIVLIYNNHDISPEEQRAQLEKHRVLLE